MKYSFTLRDGLKFHDGAPVTSEDCVASLKRWGAKDPLGRLMMAATAQDGGRRQEDVRDRAGDAVRPGPRRARQALGKSVHHAGPPGRHRPNEQVKEVDRLRALQVLQGRVAAGQPRRLCRATPTTCRARSSRAAPPAASGRLVDRVEWRYIPDPATAAAALEAGEVDYWENRPLDFAPRLEKNATITVLVTDPKGARLAPAQPPASALQQQEGSAGAALRATRRTTCRP